MRRSRVSLGRLVRYIVAVILVLATLWPFFWAASSSLKDVDEITIRPPRWLPAVPQWSNYVQIWLQVPLGRFVLNSLTVTLIAMTGLVEHRDRHQALQAGFHHHLTKPINLNALLKIITKLCDKL